MKDTFGNPEPDYIRNFALASIPSTFLSVVLLFGLQDNVKSIGGGIGLAALVLLPLLAQTWYNVKKNGQLSYAKGFSAIVLLLALIGIIAMLLNIHG